ncbi:MAG: hypothetical protein HYT98_00500 [Candidatus Sungbacteria bacterium]|nr:hypothetical protein [Candidatus Sungbacteria bacterium]
MVISPEFALLTSAVLRDVLPEKTDAIFIHAQDDLREELLGCVATLYHRLPAAPVVVLNGLAKYEPTPNSWGFEEWSSILCGPLRVLSDHVHKIPPARHTGEEAENLMKLCKKRGWRSVTIAATPYRLPRCFLTVLGSMFNCSWNMRIVIHCITVGADLNERVEKHSVIQGVIVGSRLEQFCTELEKINEYRVKYLSGRTGFSRLASFEEWSDYLQNRASYNK